MRTSLVALVILASGCGPSEFMPVSSTPAAAYESSLAAFGDGFLSSWYDTREGHREIYIRALDRDGQPAGPERRLTWTNGAAYEPDIQPLGSNVVIGWYDRSPSGRSTPRLGAWTRDGKPLWGKTLAGAGRNTVVRTMPGAVFAAWIEDDAGQEATVWGAWWHEDGSELIPARQLGRAGATTWNLNAAIDRAASLQHPRAWVAFDARGDNRAEELFVVDTAGDHPHAVQLTDDDGMPSKYPDIAIEGDRVAIAWFDNRDGNEEVYLAAGGRDMLAAPASLHATRVTTTAGHSTGAYLAWNGERIGVVWCDDSDGDQPETFFQPFTAAGTPVGSAMRLTHTKAASIVPAIKPWKSGFAIAWIEYNAPDGEGEGDDAHSQVAFTAVP